MGRFFQTSTPTFVDNKMFQLPYELMGKVLEKKDAGIQTDIDATVALADSLKAQGLKGDEGRLNEKIGEYQNRIDEQIQNIKGNVMNYDTSGIQSLKRDITKDWTRGEVAAIEKNRAGYMADLEDWKALAKSNPKEYTQEYLDRLAQASLAKFGKTDYKSPTEYNAYKGLSATALGDVNLWVEERLKGAMPNVTSVEREYNSGGWRVKRGEKTEIMSEQRLNEILEGALKADPSMESALRQRRDLGMEGFGNLFGGEKDELLNPVSFGVDEKTGQKTMGYRDSILGNAFNAGLTKYGFSKTEQTIDSKVDSFALQEEASRLKREEEAKNDEFVTMTDRGFVTPYGGASKQTFMDERKIANKRLAEIGEQGMTLALHQFGFASAEEFKEKNKATYEKVLSGDYEGAGLTSAAAKTLTKENKMLQFEQRVRNNIVGEYRRNNPVPDPTDTKAVIADNAKFSAYLAGRDQSAVEVVKGFGYLEGFTIEKQNQLVKQLNGSGHLEAARLVFPTGTTIKDKAGVDIDLSKYGSFNDMITAGIARVKQIPTGVVTEEATGTITNKAGDKVPIGMTKVIELMDGTVIGNVDIPANSVIPVFGASSSGKVQLEATINIAGKRVRAIMEDVSSTSIDKFNEVHAPTLKGRKMTAKVGTGSADLMGDGSIIYYGGAKGQKLSGGVDEEKVKTYSKGWVMVTEKDKDGKIIHRDTYDMSDPVVENFIYRKMFQ